jgi:hypothetical protein
VQLAEITRGRATGVAAALVIALGAAFAGRAAAASPRDQQYPSQQAVSHALKPPSGGAQSPAEASAAPPAAVQPAVRSRSGGLPFTGFAIGVPLVAGLALVGGGLAVRRVARRRAE